MVSSKWGTVPSGDTQCDRCQFATALKNSNLLVSELGPVERGLRALSSLPGLFLSADLRTLVQDTDSPPRKCPSFEKSHFPGRAGGGKTSFPALVRDPGSQSGGQALAYTRS